MKTFPGIPKVTEEMPFPENDQQIVTHETAPPDITLEIVSPKLYTAKLICILKIVLRAMSISNGTIQDVLYYVLRRKKPTGVAEIA